MDTTATCQTEKIAAAEVRVNRRSLKEKLVPYLPVPSVDQHEDGHFFLNYDYPDTMGRLHGYYGNYGMLVRAWAYIRLLGKEYLPEISRGCPIFIAGKRVAARNGSEPFAIGPSDTLNIN